MKLMLVFASILFASPGAAFGLRRGHSISSSSRQSGESDAKTSIFPLLSSSPSLDNIEAAVLATLATSDAALPITEFPLAVRESVGVARSVKKRLDAMARSGDCRVCWLQSGHCICEACQPLETPLPFDNLFVLMHHKEVGLAVDTAKLIAQALPSVTKIVVGGLGGLHQPSYREMVGLLADDASVADPRDQTALVLFPASGALPLADIDVHGACRQWKTVVVVDGTWSQARKLHGRLMAAVNDELKSRRQASGGDAGGVSSVRYVCLSNAALRELEAGGRGAQLRRHPVAWREVSTLEATRNLICEMCEMLATGDSPGLVLGGHLSRLQAVHDAAAKRQLGPPRPRSR